MKLEEIIPEIYTLTNSVYGREMQKLVDFLFTIPASYRKRYRILCRESIGNECQRIADFFNIKLIKSEELPDDCLMICVNYHKLRRDLGWEF